MEAKVEYSQSPPQQSNVGYGNNPAFPRPVEVRQESGWFERNQKNKPQSNSAGAGALVFMSGGMNLAWAVGFASPTFFEVSLHMRLCWFIAAIIGALAGAVLCNSVQKKFLYLFSSFLVVLGGIFLISLSENSGAVIASKYIDGYANGLILVPTLVMIGEEAVKSMRGMLASSIESVCFALGVYLQIIYGTTWDNSTMSFNVYQMQGLLSIIYGILSFLISYFLVIESPVFFLTTGREEEAIDALRRLQRPFIVTTETYDQFEEHKRYIAVNKEMSFGQSASAGLLALVKLCFYRGLSAMTFSATLTSSLMVSTSIAFGFSASWPFIIYGTLRWVCVMIAAFMMDCVGRKKPMLLGALVCGGFAIAVGVIFNDPYNLIDSSSMKMAVYFLFAIQFFAGIYISSSSAYLSEAFPLAVKPYYIAIAFIVEMAVHIIIISSSKSYFSIADSSIALGVLMLLFFVFGILALPETKYTSLREAQDMFRRFLSPRL